MPRIPLTQISFVAYEHPADRAALNTLRSIPGFDEIVRRIASWFGERSARHLFTANSVRVGPTQYPEIDQLLTEALETLDWQERPQLYVRQSPEVNAYAIGFDKPFIVINSAMVELLTPDELRFIIAHEIGHIMSGHTTYRTIALIILMVGLNGLPFLAGLAMLPFQIALLEWYRKAELSSDRAGLLGTQDIRVAQMSFLKMAGGGTMGSHKIDLDTFLVQAREYEIDGGAWDKVLKVVNTAFRDHPFATVRAAELQRYVDSGEYAKILSGDYVRRGQEKDRPLENDLREAADHYSDKARAAVNTVADALGRARDAFSDAFKGGGKPDA
ncbi:MAG TPA: M48 family metallopeptidase [Gemmatimonadaceae bacterium]|nr:M48 family metallopeptidase [Gemmatimonadaceae bacterium]